MNPAQIAVLRGGLVDSVHVCDAVVTDADGNVRQTWGDPNRMVLTRSAAKPFQAVPVVRAGVCDRFGFGPREIALICSSHNSEQFQVNVVEAMASTIGVEEDALVCASHRPLIKELGYHGADRGEKIVLAPAGRFASNCSGKHTGMIGLARENGTDGAGYEQEDHPVQRAGRDLLAEYCRLDPADVQPSVDGCGVTCWAVPLANLAVGYHTLAVQDADATRRVCDAMVAFPEFVAGHRRLDTALMRHAEGKVLSKIGAGGVYGAVHLKKKIGVAVKVIDGNSIAAGVALMHLLDSVDPDLRLVESLPAYSRPAILNTLRAVVGAYEMQQAFTLD